MWNANPIVLKQHLDSLGKQRELYIDYLDSVSRTIEIFEHHKSEAYKVISFLDTIDPKKAMWLVFSYGDENEELENKVLVAQAHRQAALYNARNMYDIFAQLINVLLFYTPKRIHECNVKSVCDNLTRETLKSRIYEVLESYEYKYVNGFVNTIKHRSLIHLNRTVDLMESRAAIRVKPFEYRNDSFCKKWAINQGGSML